MTTDEQVRRGLKKMRVGNAYRVKLPDDLSADELNELNIVRGDSIVVHVVAHVECQLVVRYWLKQRRVWRYSVESPALFLSDDIAWVSKATDIRRCAKPRFGYGPCGFRKEAEWRILLVIWQMYRDKIPSGKIADALNHAGYRDSRSKSVSGLWTSSRVNRMIRAIKTDGCYNEIKTGGNNNVAV